MQSCATCFIEKPLPIVPSIIGASLAGISTSMVGLRRWLALPRRSGPKDGGVTRVQAISRFSRVENLEASVAFCQRWPTLPRSRRLPSERCDADDSLTAKGSRLGAENRVPRSGGRVSRGVSPPSEELVSSEEDEEDTASATAEDEARRRSWRRRRACPDVVGVASRESSSSSDVV